jgi:uncharacterized membrane protein
MGKGRMEAFTDGVVAVIITIMLLEIKVPHGTDTAALVALIPIFLSYVLSFVFIAIYWNNHHHMFQAVHRVSGAALWANMHLLFWLSIVPLATGWMNENHFAPVTVAGYGLVLFACAIAYTILVRVLLGLHATDSTFARAIGSDRKGWVSLLIYAVGIVLAFVEPLLAEAAYALVALIWLLPDRRFEKLLARDEAR